MRRVGVCKDRLAEAFERFGRVTITKKHVVLSPAHPVFRSSEPSPFWSAGGLVHDGCGRVLLLRHLPSKGWGNAWLTPGGQLEEGETVLEGFEREVQEEAGLGVTGPVLTRIIQQNLTDGRRTRHGYFAQFIARARTLDPHPGSDVAEIGWFDRLPDSMDFREDYVEDFERVRGRGKGISGARF